MPNPIIKIVNVTTGEEVVREMTTEEMQNEAETVKKQKQREAELAEINAPKTAKKVALLERLGLTEDELKTILS